MFCSDPLGPTGLILCSPCDKSEQKDKSDQSDKRDQIDQSDKRDQSDQSEQRDQSDNSDQNYNRTYCKVPGARSKLPGTRS